MYGHHSRHHHNPLLRVATVAVIEPPEPLLVVADINVRQKLDLDADSPDITSQDVETMIAEATGQIDGPSGWLGRALGPQTLELSMETLGNERFIELRYPPIISLVEIVYDDQTGVEQTLDPTLYRMRRGVVRFFSVAPRSEDLRIRYRAGYATKDSPERANVPPNVLAAIKLMVGDLYRFRESAAEGRWADPGSSASVQSLLAALIIPAT